MHSLAPAHVERLIFEPGPLAAVRKLGQGSSNLHEFACKGAFVRENNFGPAPYPFDSDGSKLSFDEAKRFMEKHLQGRS
jgi:hypothetical protein